ncbi:ABC transporter permease subunit [Pseudodesulfovibrio sp. zrk46]|uniref:amino acid ABC transporter permease n=1 Tax=Pseudodesulfovibrio sp. zrk46 TaxID=2725288 RepID=UPI0014499795|nr:ABC transporter permease subunit [Pseudodesulfovibrio sp. zrk46]QJB56753.1 ABC transporter permease subunit [Pseudodesulfovibrio sp. zrk46]
MPDKSAPKKVPFWRSQQGRAWTFQICMLGGFLWLAVSMYRNTLANLETRGISSGFGFLNNEAGFGIGEITGIPLPQGGVLWFLLSLVAGLALSQLISRYQKKQSDRPMSTKWLAACLACSIGLPLVTLYCFWDSVTILHYTESSSYTLALATGLANTLKVTVIGCVASTILGLMVALGRLSPNWLLSKLCRWYVELNRNLPLLLQLFFWYFIVLQQLPNVRQSIDLGGWLILNKRGLFLPAPIPQAGAWVFCAAVIVALAGIFLILRRARRLHDETGVPGKKLLPSLALLIGLPGLAWLITGNPFALDFPALKGFNYRGGMGLTPEFTALVVGLTVYISAFNAEIIRSGIEAVSKGQREAARALAMKENQVMRVVVLPQAMRVIVPPMTSEYLAIAKSSSLAVAIGYPDFVSVGGTILNQSGQAVEIVGIWMGVYLCISLLISFGMNIYNSKVALVER